MKRQRLGENTGGTTQVTGTEFILFAPFITVVMLCFLLKYPMTNDEEFMNKSIMVNNWLSTLNK